MSNFIILPDRPGNSITEKDTPNGVFRITAASKHLFQNCPNKVVIEIGNTKYESSYKARVGRSDTLTIGKMAMADLNLKPGNSVRISKMSAHAFKIERI